MQWQAEGIVISTKPHGENHLILGVFTRDHGFHKGYVYGGNGLKKRPLMELGNLLDLKWSSRFEDQLGTFSIELVENFASVLFHDKTRLAALGVMAHFLNFLPEREAHPLFYRQTLKMMDILRGGADWHIAYILWELDFLEAFGFGLDLKKCALTDKSSGLAYVSPNTGRVATKEAGLPYADKLLGLPSFLSGAKENYDFRKIEIEDLQSGFVLTGFFLEKMFKEYFCTELPHARYQMIGYIYEHYEKNG